MNFLIQNRKNSIGWNLFTQECCQDVISNEPVAKHQCRNVILFAVFICGKLNLFL